MLITVTYVERLLTESEANLCWPSTSLVLLAPFVWLMSEYDALPIVPLSEPHTLNSPIEQFS